MKFELKYQPEKGGDWPFRALYVAPPPFKFIDWEEWCANTCAPKSWVRVGASIWFKNREDALMFIMRWS